MTKFKTLRGLAGYLVRQEGKMNAKKSRAKIGDTVQMLGVLSDLMFDDYVNIELLGNYSATNNEVIGWCPPTYSQELLLYEGAKRWKRAQKGKKK